MATPKRKDTICEAAIVAFSFNKDCSEAVFSPNNHLLYIVSCKDKTDCTTWEIDATLEQHDQSVSATAWHGSTNRILSCSQDRTAFVWQCNSKGKWKPQMVMLDAGVKRGLTCCAWNHSGSKVYVGSAAANVAVGRFDAENEWWICRLLEGHTSTVTTLAPHPSDDALLASGGTDGKLRLVSTFMKKLDEKKTASFGHVYLEKKFGAWVHAAAWAPSGRRFAVATHDSRVHVFDVPTIERLCAGAEEAVTMHRINLAVLPLKSLAFVSEDHLVGGGFDYFPVLFTPSAEAGGWRLSGKWTACQTRGVKTAQQVAREKFQNEARMGQAEVLDEGQTRHKNTINGVLRLRGDAGAAFNSDLKEPVFATASLDGRVEAWTMGEMVSIT
ncbi:putative ARP2/3 complex subunit [Trypanosoma conorhini]|uniref:Arp2/3 complex 41 kDa subunit n=1 Tax=Trypanosoma conorhini TaxID=83891 RepID=A0A422Q7L1_9TRYP|nr:putative ARP2/3 complex subunit [Trypanosoma conorhini]RNF25948.1 putative ARP2/3 complex subunit [Trypanosoma conorhini]